MRVRARFAVSATSKEALQENSRLWRIVRFTGRGVNLETPDRIQRNREADVSTTSRTLPPGVSARASKVAAVAKGYNFVTLIGTDSWGA
jgi:hypothetical protein